MRPDYKTCGNGVRAFAYMTDAFPEHEPHALHKMKCMGGRGHVRNQDVDLADDDLLFAEVEAELVPAQFLKTQRQKHE